MLDNGPGGGSKVWARPPVRYLVNAFRDRGLSSASPISNGKARTFCTLKQEVIRWRTFSD